LQEAFYRNALDGEVTEGEIKIKDHVYFISASPVYGIDKQVVGGALISQDITNRELNLNCKGFSEETLNIFTEYDWPGNIRELKNLVKRAVLISTGDIVKPEHLPAEIVQSTRRENDWPGNLSQPEDSQDLQSASGQMEKKIILKAIEDAGYNKSKAARLLNIDRKTLYNKIRKYNIDI